MGVQFDRILDAFDAPTEKIANIVKPPAGTVARSSGGWFLSHATNDAFVAINRLLKNRDDVYWMKSAFSANGKSYPAGTLYIANHGNTQATLQTLAADKGLV